MWSISPEDIIFFLVVGVLSLLAGIYFLHHANKQWHRLLQQNIVKGKMWSKKVIIDSIIGMNFGLGSLEMFQRGMLFLAIAAFVLTAIMFSCAILVVVWLIFH